MAETYFEMLFLDAIPCPGHVKGTNEYSCKQFLFSTCPVCKYTDALKMKQTTNALLIRVFIGHKIRTER